uniref:Spt20-like SEP domain-containing protein n=1 Tax=Octopus bimaculoides TaxID=37653 RepID=A0A0L8H7H7_OCTBM
MDYPVLSNGNNNSSSSSNNNNTSSGLNSIYKGKSVNQRLRELYQEERIRQPEDHPLCYATHLLPKLVKRDRLNCLVLNLYPANEGYTLMLKGRNGIDSETIKLPYEESELLGYIDASELPPLLVDILEKAQVNVFYSGCVIVEVRDYRRSTDGCYDSEYIMLKPTMQSLLCDINSMINDGHRWTQEDIFQLESQLLLATQEPLCLDPNPSVFFATNHQQYESKIFNNPNLKRSVQKHSQVALNRKRKFAQAPAPKELRLLDFINKKRSKKGNTNPTMKPIPDPRNYRTLQLSPPQSLDVEKYVQGVEKNSEKKCTDNNLTFVEEHVLEADNAGTQSVIARITFLQRPSDEFYFGEHVEGSGPGEKKCRFSLGTREDVDKYFKQFKKIFMNEKHDTPSNIKITTSQPGHSPKVTYLQPSSSNNVMSTVAMAVSQDLSNGVSTSRKTHPQHLSVSVTMATNSLQQNTISPSTTAVSPGIGSSTLSSTQHSASSQVQSHSNQPQKIRQHVLTAVK